MSEKNDDVVRQEVDKAIDVLRKGSGMRAALETVHGEALKRLDEVKSIGDRDLAIQHCRLVEALLFGEVRTPLRPRHTP